MTKTYHMVHYRRFKPENSSLLNGKTLEILCREALNSGSPGSQLWSRPHDRVFNVPDKDERKIFLNKVADLSGAVFGEICLAQAKDMQALLKMETSEAKLSDLTTATVYDLNERTAPEGSNFIRGLAYWLAINDHIFFVKTHAMTPALIQSYLDWLLKKYGAVDSADLSFNLNTVFDKSTMVGSIGDIRKFRVSGKSAPQIITAEDETKSKEVKTTRRIADKFAEMQQAVPIVEAIFGLKKAKSLIESLGRDEYLSVDASVSVRGHRTQESRKQFQNIANDLADNSDAKVQIEGKDGQVVDGDAILRTKMPFHLPHKGSNLLLYDDVVGQLHIVYERFVNDGKIEA